MTRPAGEAGRRPEGPPRAGLYIHYPFCASKCPYCHFYSEPRTVERAGAWREGIEKEAAAVAAVADDLVFDTIYLGGGTPSLLSPDEVASLGAIARGTFRAEIDEFTLEANPADERTGCLRGWHDAGVTRLSIGVQSFDDDVLRTLGRSYAAAEAMAFCLKARETGFDSLSIDLIIGVPGETLDSLSRTLEAARSLEPDHVSVYFLENVEGLPFEKVLARHPVDEDAAVGHYRALREALEALGLRQYEISNFARPGLECLHNLKYWQYGPYLGLGPSACSHVGLERWCNKEPLDAWADALRRGHSPRGEDTVALTPTAAAREALIFGLRLVEGIDLDDLQARTGVNVCALFAREIDELASDGLLIQAGGRLRIPADKLLVSNAILSRFI